MRWWVIVNSNLAIEETFHIRKELGCVSIHTEILTSVEKISQMIKSDIQYSNKLHLFFALVIVATTFQVKRVEEHFLIPFIHSSIGPMDILFVLTILALSPFRLNKLFFMLYFLLVTVVTMSANLFINVYMAEGMMSYT